MLSSERLSSKVQDAIQRGRAIPLLVDYRPPELPDHTLTVYGLIDGCLIEGMFLADDDDGSKLVAMPLPWQLDRPIPEIQVDSEDAEAVHEIWAKWHGWALDSYLLYTRVMAQLINQSRLKEALADAKAVESSDTKESVPGKKTKKVKDRAKRTQKSSKNKQPK